MLFQIVNDMIFSLDFIIIKSKSLFKIVLKIFMMFKTFLTKFCFQLGNCCIEFMHIELLYALSIQIMLTIPIFSKLATT